MRALPALFACARRPVAAHLDEPFPERLSEWRLFVGRSAELAPNAGVLAYDVSVPLFSDNAYKHRTVWMPEGTSAAYRADGPFEFPLGTLFSKTFYYQRGDGANEVGSDASAGGGALVGTPTDRRLVETRLLVRAARGWVALPYVWDEAQTEATLQVAGDERRYVWRGRDGAREAFVYVVPYTDQCAECHVRIKDRERRLRPLGPTARQLNREYAYADGPRPQLARWQELGRLHDAPAARARAYLDVQCAHCHAPDGPAVAVGALAALRGPRGCRPGRMQAAGGRRPLVRGLRPRHRAGAPRGVHPLPPDGVAGARRHDAGAGPQPARRGGARPRRGVDRVAGRSLLVGR